MLELDFIAGVSIALIIGLVGSQAILFVVSHTSDVVDLSVSQKKLILCSEELLNNPSVKGIECDYKISKTPTQHNGFVLRRLIVKDGEVVLVEVW